jgi:hypothetical protein
MGGGPVRISPLDLIVKRVIAKGFFMNHPDIEPKIPAALREAVPRGGSSHPAWRKGAPRSSHNNLS